MRILVTGDRNWTDRDAIYQALLEHGATEVVHGAASGADTLAGQVALNMQIPILVFPAQWNRYGKRAGPVRNQQMLDEGKPDLVLAFHPDLAKSKGTADMVRRAQGQGFRVVVYGGKENESEGRQTTEVPDLWG